MRLVISKRSTEARTKRYRKVPLKHFQLVCYVVFVSVIVLIDDREPHGRYRVTPKASRNCVST